MMEGGLRAPSRGCLGFALRSPAERPAHPERRSRAINNREMRPAMPTNSGFTLRGAARTLHHSFNYSMGNLKKKRRLKMSKHKRRKRLKANRHKKRTWQK